jgi:hypothetical protein
MRIANFSLFMFLSFSRLVWAQAWPDEMTPLQRPEFFALPGEAEAHAIVYGAPLLQLPGHCLDHVVFDTTFSAEFEVPQALISKIDKSFTQGDPLMLSGGGAQTQLNSSDIPRGFFINQWC